MAFRFEDTGTQTAHGLTLNTFAAESAGALNSYANVTAINGNQITINRNDILYGAYEEFDVGVDILFHVSATTSANYKTYLGCYCVATITAVEDSVLTLDKDVTEVLPADEFSHYRVQVVTIARFGTLTLESGVSIVPPAYSTTHFYGGIVAIKCFGDLNFAGGHINLVDRGLPVSAKSIRPTTAQEDDGTLDTDKHAGWENSQTHERFLLNCGDGAAFIIVRGYLHIANTDSRIGNPDTHGAQFCRGASDSVGDKPDNITNIGGSTILIAAKKLSNFTPALIAKYRAANVAKGQGICRCYIASDTKLRNDEGLYAYDCISDPTRLLRELNIKNFGNGSHGICSKDVLQNNYARVVAISADRKRVTYADKTTDGVAQITKGALVMIHATHRETPPDEGNTIAANTGTFRLANVLDDNGSVLTLDSPTINLDPVTYAIQVVSIPQYTRWTAGQTKGMNFDGDKGGIFAIAVNEDVGQYPYWRPPDNQVLTQTQTKAEPYGRGGLRYIGNAQMCNRLPIGQGFMSAFILVKHLSLHLSESNDGPKASNFFGPVNMPGSRFGGKSATSIEGGYKGNAADETYADDCASGAGGAIGAAFPNVEKNEGGYGSHGAGENGSPTTLHYSSQGAHIFIVADTIENFSVDAIHTGGAGGHSLLKSGGAGYGGAGGTDNGSSGAYNAGGTVHKRITSLLNFTGGSSGWCFIYCNKAVNPSTYATVLFD